MKFKEILEKIQQHQYPSDKVRTLCNEEFKQDVITAIREEHPRINEEQAVSLYVKAWGECSAKSYHEILIHADELAVFVSNILEKE